ncbi:glycoside hydrolase family 2 TIM barrel-domain containing protein [Algibacter mikhailovii]|uniref:glycoside hydrolase family 2 TIM barrel-domain containing protein n=1 Tax=Algibacter mikhailovii TaxID=425498 RepID=UPI0016723CE8|nr:glycoside hydrolase family 2 TIM barrel-domain containing protein [Algibacter mikhailovii]
MIKVLKNIVLFLFLLSCGLVSAFFYFRTELNKSVDERRSVYIKTIDSKPILFRNGKPFKIRGAAGARDASFELLSKIGGNTIKVYDTINLKSVLDRAFENQLAVIVDIRLPKYNEKYNAYSDQNQNDKLKQEVKKLVLKYRNHPALLCWNLGNEIDYPFVLIKNSFINTYNQLIDIIHTNDPNHLISTTLTASVKQTLAIHYHSPNLDLLGFNTFGALKRLDLVLERVNLIREPLPFYIGEYGYNGPWEQESTSWGAPIEPTSTKKSEMYANRFYNIVENDMQSVGDLVFYWGQKQERTHTWFSIFDEAGRTSEVYYKLNELWGGKSSNLKHPPKIDYMLIDNKGAKDNLIYKPDMVKTAQLFFEKNKNSKYQIVWEIYAEGWDYNLADIEKDPLRISKDTINSGSSHTFKTPDKTGPYRIFVYVYDDFGNYATTNTPFYILE